jgi:hypothetical protein
MLGIRRRTYAALLLRSIGQLAFLSNFFLKIEVDFLAQHTNSVTSSRKFRKFRKAISTK